MERVASVGIKDRVVRTPGTAARVPNPFGNHFRPSGGGKDLPQLPLREEADPSAVGRPKWHLSVLGSGQRVCDGIIHRPQPENRNSTGSGGRKYHRTAIGRQS